jgi:hypothetical protein
MVGVKMTKETFALINDQDQVINHIVIDKDDANFETNMAGQLAHWGCVRYVETDLERDDIILDERPTIWTTHTEETGFVLPEGYKPIHVEVAPSADSNPVAEIEKVTIGGRVYPKDSLLIAENASRRAADWTFPEGEVEVSLKDID